MQVSQHLSDFMSSYRYLWYLINWKIVLTRDTIKSRLCKYITKENPQINLGKSNTDLFTSYYLQFSSPTPYWIYLHAWTIKRSSIIMFDALCCWRLIFILQILLWRCTSTYKHKTQAKDKRSLFWISIQVKYFISPYSFTYDLFLL